MDVWFANGGSHFCHSRHQRPALFVCRPGHIHIESRVHQNHGHQQEHDCGLQDNDQVDGNRRAGEPEFVGQEEQKAFHHSLRARPV